MEFYSSVQQQKKLNAFNLKNVSFDQEALSPTMSVNHTCDSPPLLTPEGVSCIIEGWAQRKRQFGPQCFFLRAGPAANELFPSNSTDINHVPDGQDRN